MSGKLPAVLPKVERDPIVGPSTEAVYRVRSWRDGGAHYAELVRAPWHRRDMPRDVTGVNGDNFADRVGDVAFRYDVEIVLEWA